MFQFQTGAIKRIIPDTAATPLHPRFNSKLVRLKADRCYVLRLPWLFQFQTGAIKSQRANARIASCSSFNSKLVRLKGLELGGA